MVVNELASGCATLDTPGSHLNSGDQQHWSRTALGCETAWGAPYSTGMGADIDVAN